MRKLNECVECGNKDIRTVKKDLEFRRENPGRIKIKDQECLECSNCGKLYFDEKQSDELAKKIDRKIKH